MKKVNILRSIKYRIRRSIHYYNVLYADSTELLEKAKKLLRPLPEGCRFEKITPKNKNFYKCTFGDVDKMLHVDGDVWAVVNENDEIIAYHFGTYRGKKSLFFNVKNCDFEHIELKTDKKYRRQGLGLHLLYHMVKNLNFDDVNHKRLGTVIEPSNIPSMKLHELIGFKVSHKVLFWGIRRKKDSRYTFINIPHFNI